MIVLCVQIRVDAQNKLKNAEADLESMQETIEELEDGKADLQKQLMKANAEIAQLKAKFEQEVSGRVEELEDAKWVILTRINPFTPPKS